MKQDQFCFWLQGHFELNPEAGIEGNQLTQIRAHLELVKKCSVDKRKNPVPISGFCAWLDGALDLAPTYVIDDITKVLPEAVEAIKNKLNDEFQHVIDPQMPGDKEELQAVHDGLRLTPEAKAQAGALLAPGAVKDLTKTCALSTEDSSVRDIVIDVAPPKSESDSWPVVSRPHYPQMRPGGGPSIMC